MSIRLDDAIIRKLEVTNEGKFVYSGIQEASTNSARPVWFSNNSGPSVPVYSDTFKYNPSTRSLELTPTSDGNAYLKTTQGVLRLQSASTLYINRGDACSLIFQLNGAENARFDTSGHFRPKEENTYSLGTTSYPWKDAYARRYLAYATGATYAYLNASTLGTTGTVGVGRLSLGNSAAEGTANNAKGQILFYGKSTSYLIVETNIGANSRTLYLRDHGKTAYTVGTAGTGAVGGSTHPVYVNSSGLVTACGSLWTNSDLDSTTEFQVGATSAAGKIYLYSQETSTKNRGIYGSNSSGTQVSILVVDKDNNVSLNGSSTKLASGKTLKVSLGSTNASTAFNGTANVHDIGVSGTLAPGNGGTGQTTLKAAANSLINALDTGSSTPVDNDYYISQYVGGGTTTTTYHRRPMSALWNYIAGKGDGRYVNVSGDTMTGALNLSWATTTTMDHTSTNPRIVFSENGTQPVGLIYTDYDSYRGPAGLKVQDMSGSNGKVWFEVQGAIYSGSNIYSIHPTGGETNINVAHGPDEYLMLWGNNSSGTRGLWDSTKGSVISVTDTSATFHGNAATATKATQDGNGNTITSKYVTLDTSQVIKATKSFQNAKYYSSFNFYPSLITGGESRIATIYGWCASGSDATVISTSYISFRQYSYTANSTTTLSNYDQFRFPATPAGKTANNTYYIMTSQGGTINGTLVLAKTTDASATANNSPALIVGGTSTTGHIEIDSNEIIAKTNGTTVTTLYLNNGGQVTVDGGLFRVTNTTESSSTSTGAVVISGGLGVGKNIYGAKVYGAVWNDYAEYRSQFENISAGRVAYCKNDGKLRITTERLQKFEGVVSDTFGFAIGETNNAKTPLAVSGRVLVYTYEPRDIFNSGDCVCAAPNGTVSKMTREEIVAYPDRIVGIVSEIPDYEIWGTGEVPVNGRIWIKVK